MFAFRKTIVCRYKSSILVNICRWISGGKLIPNKLAYYIQLSYFYTINIAKLKLYEISMVILVSILIGNPPYVIHLRQVSITYLQKNRMAQTLCKPTGQINRQNDIFV